VERVGVGGGVVGEGEVGGRIECEHWKEAPMRLAWQTMTAEQL